MKRKKLLDHLDRLGACSEAQEWAKSTPGRCSALWLSCPRGDWLLWLAARAGVDRRLVVLAACDCAETALQYVPEGEDRPRVAIETARAWCRGDASLDDVRSAAAAAAYAAYASYASYANAAEAYAAYAAAYAAYAAEAVYASDTAYANAAYTAYANAAYAANAAYVAYVDAAYANTTYAANAANAAAHARFADLVRDHVRWVDVEEKIS